MDRGKEPGSRWPRAIYWRWKRKWALIHNTASLKTVTRWNLIIVIDCWPPFLYVSHLSLCTRRLSSKTRVFMNGFCHNLVLYVHSCPPPLMKAGGLLSPHHFMLVNAQMRFFFFYKTWGSCRWPGKATADIWDYRRSWRCEPGMTWCWSVPPVHPNHRSTLGIRTWESFCRCQHTHTSASLWTLAFLSFPFVSP